MTSEEFNAKQAEELEDIPKEFHPAIRMWAYDHGHSSGYEEVLNYVRGLAYELKPAIEQYRLYLRENGG